MEIYLIRHTTPDIGRDVCYGQLDMEVDYLLFQEELMKIQSKIPQEIEQFYSSPLKRCRVLAQTLSPEFCQSDLLKELNFGNWEGQQWSKIQKNELNPWMEDFVNAQVPDGESYLNLYNRTEDFIRKLLNTPFKRVAIITHAGNIRSFISYVLGLPLENSFRVALNYGSVVHIEIHENPALGKVIGIY